MRRDLFVCSLRSVGALALSCVPVLGIVQSCPSFAQQIDAGRQEIRLEVPGNASLENIRVWFNQTAEGSEISGIQFFYRTAGSGAVQKTVVAGSEGQFSNDLLVSTARVEGIFISTNRQGNFGKIGFRQDGKFRFAGDVDGGIDRIFDPGQELFGLVVNTDGQHIYSTRPLTREIQRQAAPAISASGGSAAFVQSVQAQRTLAPQAGSTSDDFSDPVEPAAGATQPGPVERAPAQRPLAVVQNQPAALNYDGIWVDTTGSDPRAPRADEAPGGITDRTRTVAFIAPKYIRIRSVSADVISIQAVNVQSVGGDVPTQRKPLMFPATFSAGRQLDGSFAIETIGGPDKGTVAFTRGTVPGGLYATVTMIDTGFSYLGGKYRLATLLDRQTLSRDRFSAELMEGRLSATDAFTNQLNQARFSPNLYGYNALAMSPDEPENGRSNEPLFATSASQKGYSYDGTFGKSFPYGFRGSLNKRAVSGAAKISLTTEKETQAQTAQSMGGNIMGLGLTFAKDQSRAVVNKQSSITDINYARGFRYTVYLDLPNVALDPVFHDSLEAFAANPVNARDIIDTYGTHYANAIAYGGSKKCTESSNISERVNSAALRNGIDIGASTPRGGGSISTSMGNSDSAGTSTSTSTQSCSALGGQGVDGAWSLSDDDSIPLLYDLRPLSELINVVTFPEADHNAALRLNAARNILEREINARLAVAGNLSSSPLRREGRAPQVWDIMVTEVKCVFTGDPNAQIGTIDVLGRISAEFKDVRGTIPLQLFGTQFDLSAGKEAFKFQPMTCGGMNSAGIPVNQTVRLLVRPDERGDGNFRFSVDNLVKYQPAKNAGVDTAYVLSRGWWVSFSILDAVLGPNTITPGGLAKGLDNEIDKLRGDVLGSSRRIVTNSTIEHYVLPAQPVGWQSPNVIFHQIGGGAGGEPLLWVGYTMKRIE